MLWMVFRHKVYYFTNFDSETTAIKLQERCLVRGWVNNMRCLMLCLLMLLLLCGDSGGATQVDDVEDDGSDSSDTLQNTLAQQDAPYSVSLYFLRWLRHEQPLTCSPFYASVTPDQFRLVIKAGSQTEQKNGPGYYGRKCNLCISVQLMYANYAPPCTIYLALWCKIASLIASRRHITWII